MILTQENYIEKAERAIKTLRNRKDERSGKSIKMVTTSKIRNLLAMAADIYNEVLSNQDEQLSKDICERIDYMQIRMVYEYGRDNDKNKPVQNFIKEAQLLDCIKEVHGSKKNYILFNRYMEALVAYHKFYGGAEN